MLLPLQDWVTLVMAELSQLIRLTAVLHLMLSILTLGHLMVVMLVLVALFLLIYPMAT